jgi:hypothetical protein
VQTVTAVFVNETMLLCAAPLVGAALAAHVPPPATTVAASCTSYALAPPDCESCYPPPPPPPLPPPLSPLLWSHHFCIGAHWKCSGRGGYNGRTRVYTQRGHSCICMSVV